MFFGQQFFGGRGPQFLTYICKQQSRLNAWQNFVPTCVAVQPRIMYEHQQNIQACRAAKMNKTKDEPMRCKLSIRSAHALNPSFTIFVMWGGPPDVFLKFEFQSDRCKNFGAVGVKYPPSH